MRRRARLRSTALGRYRLGTAKAIWAGAGVSRGITLPIKAEQILRLNVQTPAKSSLLSIYLPRPTPELPILLEDSTEMTWVGKLPQSGYYEIVIVNKADQPIRYQMTLAVDNVTSTPVKPEKAEAPEAKD